MSMCRVLIYVRHMHILWLYADVDEWMGHESERERERENKKE